MKWALASIGLLVVIVVFSMAALDQKDVVWEGGKPLCPHCRSEVRPYSGVCATCGRAFDWQSYDEPCSACLSEIDADYYRKKLEKHEEAFHRALVARGVPEEALPDFDAWMKRYRSGACGFCGGTGRWLAPGLEGPPSEWKGAREKYALLRKTLEGDCPVCLGTGRCILCDGDHRTTYMRESAHVAFAELGRDLRQLQPDRDRRSAAAWMRLVHRFLRREAGRAEVASLPAATGHGHQLDWASARLALVRRALDRLE